ncbi:hypothetical protein, partial [Rhodovastum atsumiense]
MAILTRSGRTALAIALLEQPIHLAWGTGLAAWDDTPAAESATATALVAEVGRRALTESRFVMNLGDWVVDQIGPPPNGTTKDDWGLQHADLVPAGKLLVVPTGRYVDVNPTPSNEVYVRFQFDYEDGASPPATIREIGVFVGTVIKPSVITATPGKMYFPPADLQDPGKLLALQHNPKIVRQGNVR